MHKSVRYIWLLLISSIFLMSGCNQRTEIIPMPDFGVPSEEMNTKIHLEVPEGWNTYKIGEAIEINVEVIAKEKIAFEYDYDAKIFVLEDKEWVEVPNLMEYPEGTLILPPSNGEPNLQGSASVDPVLPKFDHQVTIRIVLMGNIYRNEQVTNERVASYVDVVLKP
jgi:hypothetical protein